MRDIWRIVLTVTKGKSVVRNKLLNTAGIAVHVIINYRARLLRWRAQDSR